VVDPAAANRQTARVLLSALPIQLAFGLVYAWGAVAPFVVRDQHWSPLLVSAVFSATPIGYGVGIVLGGRLADRLPPRRLCWTGFGLLAAGFAVALTAPSGPTFIVFYAMLGLGLGGGISLAGSIAAARYALPGRAGTAGGLATGVYAVGAPLVVPIVSLLAAAIGWVDALRILCAALLTLGAVTLALMPALPRPSRLDSDPGHPGARRLLARPRLWTAILLQVCATPLGAYAFVNTATYARGLALAAVVATAAITAVGVGNAVGRIGGGILSDRIGVDRVMLAVLIVDAIAAVVMFRGPVAPALVAAALVAGIGFGAPAGALGRLAQDAAPDAPNSAFGLIFTGFAAGAGGGSILGAAIGGRLAWLAMGGLAVVGLAVVALRLSLGRRGLVLTTDGEDDGQHDGQDSRHPLRVGAVREGDADRGRPQEVDAGQAEGKP